MNCTAEGMQPPSFAWYREVPGQPPKQLNDTLFTTEPGVVAYEVVSVLPLSSVEPIDTASYICEATNDLGSDNDTAEVTVLGKSFLPRSALRTSFLHPPFLPCAAVSLAIATTGLFRSLHSCW